MQVLQAKPRTSFQKPVDSVESDRVLETQKPPDAEAQPKNKGGRPRKHQVEAGKPKIEVAKDSGRSSFPKPSGGVVQKKFDHLLKYWQALTPAMCSRARMHVYRTWPVINRVLSGSKVQSIWVFQEDPSTGTKGTCHYDLDNWQQQLLHEFGSGDYKFILCELGVSGAIAVCNFVSVRDAMIPPKLNYVELDKGDKLNADYIDGLRRQGIKLPGDTGYESKEEKDEEAEMAAQQTIDRLTDKIITLADRPQPTPAQPKTVDDSAASRSIEMVAKAADRAGEIVQEAQKQATALQGKQMDPLQMLNVLSDVVEKIAPKRNEGSDPMVTLLMEQNAALQREMRDRDERRAKEDREHREKEEERRARDEERREREHRERAAADKPKTLVEMLREQNEIDELRGNKKSSGGKKEDDEEGKETIVEQVVKYMPLAVTGLTTLFALGANIVHNMKLKPGEAPQPVPQAPQQAVQQQTQALMTGQTVEEANAQQAQQAQLHMFLQQIEGPFLNHFFSTDLNGYTFADHIYTSHQQNGPIVYAQIKNGGKDFIINSLSTYPPIWSKVGGLRPGLDQFFDEFMQYEEWKAEQASGVVDDDEEEAIDAKAVN